MTTNERPQRGSPRAVSIALLSIGIALGTLATMAVHELASHRGDGVEGVEAELSRLLDLPPNAINATATHGIDSFAIATGHVDENTEAIYFLDFLTGELKGAAISRQTKKFASLYKREILQDFIKGEDRKALKNPRFLLVTGMGSLQQRGGRGGRLAIGLIYVVEVNSGKVVVYAVPDTTSTRAIGNASANEFIPVDTLSLRKRDTVRPGSQD